MSKSRYLIRVTSVSGLNTHKDLVTIRGVPIESFRTQSAKKVVFAKVAKNDLPILPEVGQHWKLTGTASEHYEIVNGFKYLAVKLDVSNAKVTLPDTGELFIDFVSSCADFKGIGAVKARELWNKFGKGIYDLMKEQNPKSFESLLSPESIKALLDGWRKYDNLKYQSWLSGLGIRPEISGKIVKYHKEGTINSIKENPYRMMTFGMSFKDSDALAQTKFNMSLNDDRRLVAAVEQVLNQWIGKGHTFAYRDDIFSDVITLLQDKQAAILALKKGLDNGTFIIADEGTYHPTGMLVIERIIAKRFKKLAKLEAWSFQHDDAYEQACSSSEFPLTERQGEAVYNALNYSISAVFGGAGTGKTTVIRSVVAGFEALGFEIHQIALSGRAAKRMRESTGRPTKTIAAFLRDEPVVTEKAAVIIDESSMVDANTMYQIITHTHDSVKFVLIGDPDQLPPIGAGLVLHAIQDSKLVPKVTLDIVKRQDAESGIPGYSCDVKNGIVPERLSTGAVTFHEVPETEINETIVGLYAEATNATQIIAATYKRENGGINALNHLEQTTLNNSSPELQFSLFNEDFILNLKVGDPILLTKNDIKLDIQNGTLGELTSVATTENGFGEITLDDNRIINLDEALLDHIQLAYAISLHKAQGSQFERIVIPIVPSKLLDRGWIYTAITRAEKEVHLIGNAKLFKRYIKEPSKAHLRQIYLSKLLN
ncbi:ATP-dependent DNA helicase [Shewanella woodyi]|uniref:AAA ATPase n=1 Tax=Shewanella woodyi (strain ATCC 51908 / MS32) TaxID=392500 RepID=B1KNB0_SHEWM|nr:ATP-dependent RecD-like DNA helicase [Shewanella woodyi]ACA84607.1 AAA ATPase [Shewanella woodyi ATCC 51908]